tara:strand:+ start:334 stop:555 length:222 start_codon:yes stop_codon:yes gene_type:complete
MGKKGIIALDPSLVSADIICIVSVINLAMVIHGRKQLVFVELREKKRRRKRKERTCLQIIKQKLLYIVIHDYN